MGGARVVTAVTAILTIHVLSQFNRCTSERIQYLNMEHPSIIYYNRKYVSYANATSRRYSRSDPFYYVGLNIEFVRPIDDNITVHFIFYELLSNRYRRSFIEMHFKICDLIQKDKFFGVSLRQGKLDQPCPYQPGAYNLYNLTVPVKNIPPHFPFTKGRIVCNLTSTDTKELVGSGYIDMEIKEMITKRVKAN